MLQRVPHTRATRRASSPGVGEASPELDPVCPPCSALPAPSACGSLQVGLSSVTRKCWKQPPRQGSRQRDSAEDPLQPPAGVPAEQGVLLAPCL